MYARALRVATFLVAASMSVYHLIIPFIGTPEALFFRGAHLAFSLALVYLLYPGRVRGAERPGWLDFACIALALATIVYLWIHYDELQDRIVYVDDPTRVQMALGIIFIILVLVVSAIVYAIAPIFARLTQATVSREREYLADASAVELGRNPEALERALLKIASSTEVLEAANRATAPLYFVNPIRAFEERASAIFSTHPRTLDRVNRLRSLQGEPPLAEAQAARIAEDVD